MNFQLVTHLTYVPNILFGKTSNCHPDNCKYVCTTSTQDGIRYINNNEYGNFDLQDEENSPPPVNS